VAADFIATKSQTDIIADVIAVKMKFTGIARTILELLLIGLIILLWLRPSARAQSWKSQVITSVPVRQKLVALTYDDGPSPDFTPKILAQLKQHHIKATFFMVGKNMEAYPEIVKQVIAQGHAIGNHTYDHPRDIEAALPEQVIRELEKCEIRIEQFTGKRTHLFRPPRGLVNGTVVNIAIEEGYKTVLWTVSADHHDAPTPELMAKRVLQRIKPGAIILAHDGSFPSRIKDVEATPLIIQELTRQGYKFVTLPELLKAAELN
jgi:peptidoglycan-N-acetylglucosamine deacetylase